MSELAVAEHNLLGNLVAGLNQANPYTRSNLLTQFSYDHKITMRGELSGTSPRLSWRQSYDFQLHVNYMPWYPQWPLVDRIVLDAETLFGRDLRSAPVGHQVLQVNLQYALGPYVIVDGEWCSWWEDEDLGVVIQRKPWSLLGTGKTLRDAIDNFRENAARHAVGMQHEKFGEMTEDAWEMRGFVVRYLPHNG
ncbi:MAG: hypothetical protein OXF01_19140 [Gemmatimonadetes bacterium]|nr:hypothetical protein [Gemmatimonadota bacterium]